MTTEGLKPIGELADGETVTSESFKPCPFCGQTTIYLRTGNDGAINCPDCLVRMPNECNDHIELVHCWNTRADDELIDKLVEALNTILDAEIIYTGGTEEPMRTCGMDSILPLVKMAEEALALADKWRKI